MALINMYFVPSLKNIAINKIAITLCTNTDLCTQLQQREVNFKSWFRAEQNFILDMIKKLPIPHNLDVELCGVMKEIMYRIKQWISNNRHTIFFHEYLRKRCHLFEWTVLGEIDIVKTANKLVNFDFLDVDSRYYVACYYCIEDAIYKLRPHVERLHFDKVKHRNMKCVNSLVSFYWQRMIDRFPDPKFSAKDLFITAYKDRNLGAMKYFFKQMLPGELHSVICSFSCSLVRLSSMTESFEHLKCFFMNATRRFRHILILIHLHFFLGYFLEWPQMNHLSEIVDSLRLVPKDFYWLLVTIAYKGKDSENIIFHVKRESIFRSVWGKGTPNARRYAIQQMLKRVNALSVLLDHKSLALVLSEANVEERKIIRSNIHYMKGIGPVHREVAATIVRDMGPLYAYT